MEMYGGSRGIWGGDCLDMESQGSCIGVNQVGWELWGQNRVQGNGRAGVRPSVEGRLH